MTAFVPDTGDKDLGRYALSLQQLAAGRSNAVGTVTCSTLAKTTVTDANHAASSTSSTGSRVYLTPATSNAAAFVTSIWQSSTGALNGSFTLDHTVAATTDRTFSYAIRG